ncbi:chromosomal replication initiator protein DnaA [Candidatus Daviesbacteria bacterium]|nr:chromosomal replication initiator protein DnaA [Candidatus Daviesbacteria bacterium]
MERQWLKVLDLIKDEVSSANFRTWFAPTSADPSSNGKLVVVVPSAFVKQQLTTRYAQVLDKAIERIFGKDIPLDFKIDSSKKAPALEDGEGIDFSFGQTSQVSSSNSGLNPKYTMENFVVGLSNNLAHAAAQAVIQNPGTSYNPLFIYGGTGVGKTHLMQAAGNALLTKRGQLKVIYCSSEKFTNDFIQSIQNKKTGDFRAKYRACDLLLIDDVQFISGRDSTQEEFFHTFNELHTKNSQIILTSDRPPQEMQKLESRLLSRFQGGLMVDIQLPDFDTRVAILRAKCQERSEVIPEECLTLIAEQMPTNARELEGKLIQIIQTTKLTNQPFSLEVVKNLLGKSVGNGDQKLDYKKVISVVNQYFNIKMADLTGPRRKKELVLPRHIAMYLLYEECKVPFEKIGDILGGRDHTTILHGVDKIRQNYTRDREIQRMIIEIKQSLT